MTIRVFLATSHVTFADSLQALLEAQRDLKVVGKAINGHDAVKRVQRLRPEVAVVAIALPGMNGIEATSKMRDLSPSTGIVILSGSFPPEFIQRALQAGAKGYLPKEASGAEVVDAVRAVSRGKRYLSRKITTAIIHDYININRSASPLDSLSPRERQVLQLVVEGESSARVASVLSLSRKSVDTYRSRIRQKLGIYHLPGLVKFAIQNGITSPE
ncbi:MAG TPA: response regulator transcription factor [Burkholderiales bacterium]|nr:response regulator transcription factor [Burkholderiales bacterium]